MRSHLALILVVAFMGAACTRTIRTGTVRDCSEPRAQTVAHHMGIIGMSLDQQSSTDGGIQLIVDRVVPDGPAAAAGIRPGDRILEIEGTSTDGMSIADAARRFRGPVDASIALVIATGSRPREVSITRIAPSELWSGLGHGSTGHPSERVRASDVAPATTVTVPPCRH